MLQLTLRSPPLVFAQVSGPSGKRELCALVSPSSRYCLISRRDVDNLGYSTGPYHRRLAFLPDVNREHALALVTVGGILETPIVSLQEVALGNIVVERVQAAVFDLPEPTGFDMMLGYAFFSTLKLTLDYMNELLTLEEPH